MTPDLRERLARELCATYCEIYTGRRCDRCARWNKEHLPELTDAALRLIAAELQEPASAGMCRATVDESGLIATLPADVWERMVAAWLREQGVTDA